MTTRGPGTSGEAPQRRRSEVTAVEVTRSSAARGDEANPPDCILEVVARLAGEPWTDRPTSVHSTLGSIARAAYEHSSAVGRAAMLPMAPALVDTARVGLETPARLVATCVSTALASPEPDQISAEESCRLVAARSTALYLLGRCGCGVDDGDRDHVRDTGGTPRWWTRLLDPVRMTEPFYRVFVAPDAAAAAVAVTARASGDERDQRLRQLLRWCIAVTVQAPPVRADDESAGGTGRDAPRCDGADDGAGRHLRGV